MQADSAKVLSVPHLLPCGALSTCSSVLFRTIYIMLDSNELRHIILSARKQSKQRESNTMANYTLSLSDAAATRIKHLAHIFGGSVGGFAASLADDVSRLPPEEIARLRQEISARIRIMEMHPHDAKRHAPQARD